MLALHRQILLFRGRFLPGSYVAPVSSCQGRISRAGYPDDKHKRLKELLRRYYKTTEKPGKPDRYLLTPRSYRHKMGAVPNTYRLL